jgi:hypothetical protein
MSAAMPHTGGAYSFARSAMGPWGGFVTGFAETVAYVITTAVVGTFAALYADAIMKYRGVSVYAEYAQRTAADPITVNSKDSSQKAAVLVGTGYLAQVSYCFPSMFEVSGRYAVTDADAALAGLKEYVKNENTSVTCTYYANRHRVKCNLELGRHRQTAYNNANAVTTSYYARFNTEIGI